MPIQGTEADLMKLAMVRVDERFEILLGDSPSGAGASHLIEVNPVLARHFAHQRR